MLSVQPDIALPAQIVSQKTVWTLKVSLCSIYAKELGLYTQLSCK